MLNQALNKLEPTVKHIIEALMKVYQLSQENEELEKIDTMIEVLFTKDLSALSISQRQFICEILEKYIEEVFPFEAEFGYDYFYNELEPILNDTKNNGSLTP